MLGYSTIRLPISCGQKQCLTPVSTTMLCKVPCTELGVGQYLLNSIFYNLLRSESFVYTLMYYSQTWLMTVCIEKSSEQLSSCIDSKGKDHCADILVLIQLLYRLKHKINMIWARKHGCWNSSRQDWSAPQSCCHLSDVTLVTDLSTSQLGSGSVSIGKNRWGWWYDVISTPVLLVFCL